MMIMIPNSDGRLVDLVGDHPDGDHPQLVRVLPAHHVVEMFGHRGPHRPLVEQRETLSLEAGETVTDKVHLHEPVQDVHTVGQAAAVDLLLDHLGLLPRLGQEFLLKVLAVEVLLVQRHSVH